MRWLLFLGAVTCFAISQIRLRQHHWLMDAWNHDLVHGVVGTHRKYHRRSQALLKQSRRFTLAGGVFVVAFALTLLL